MEYAPSDAVQVGHLFIKASDQGIISQTVTASALANLFPDLFEEVTVDDAIQTAVAELIEAADRGEAAMVLTANVRACLDVLRGLLKMASSPPAS